jgi:hypothetical protein
MGKGFAIWSTAAGVRPYLEVKPYAADSLEIAGLRLRADEWRPGFTNHVALGDQGRG